MSSTTDNLSLEIIDSSDYVSPDPINDNFEIVDKLGVDYVTSSGTSGSWWYRKWKSGRAECGIDYKSFGSVTIQTAYGDLYKANKSFAFGSYPFTFSSTPMVVITPRYWSTDSSIALIVKYGNSSSTSTCPKFDIIAVGKRTLSSFYAGVYVCGKVSS